MKLQIKSVWFNLYYSLFTLIVFNIPFILAAYRIKNSIIMAAMIGLAIFAALNLVTNILFIKRLVKPLSIILCLFNASVLYFMLTYGVVFDKIMLLNVLQTDVYEVTDLLSIKMIAFFLLCGGLPSLLIYKTKIIFAESKNKLISITVSALVIAAIMLTNMQATNFILRKQKHIKSSLIPLNYIGAAISVTKTKMRYANIPLRNISDDAKMKSNNPNKKPLLLVFVVGESARAANFSFQGYQRRTNEPLEIYKDELLYFQDFSSCGTSTAVSLPCIFALEERKDFKAEAAKYSENLLDIIDKSGYKVLWRENSTDCKGNCDRVEIEKFCHVKECSDEIMLTNFAKKVKSTDKPTMVIMHQRGSHGPLYKLRYPQEFEKYTPVCESEYLKNCSVEEITNVYDNTIYYGSYVLAKVIDELKALSNDYNVAFIFTSDHGESLGEDGIYLHSAPYEQAPSGQNKVPLILWFSRDYTIDNNLDMQCVKKLLQQPYSHDNIFHTMLGISSVESKYYNQKLDILSDCRK